MKRNSRTTRPRWYCFGRDERVKLIEKNSSSIELRLPSRLGYEKVAMNTAASVAKLMGFTDEPGSKT